MYFCWPSKMYLGSAFSILQITPTGWKHGIHIVKNIPSGNILLKKTTSSHKWSDECQNLWRLSPKEKYFSICKSNYNRKIFLNFLKNFNLQRPKEYKLAISKQDIPVTKYHHLICTQWIRMEKYKVFQPVLRVCTAFLIIAVVFMSYSMALSDSYY